MLTIDLSGKPILLTGAMGAITEQIVRRLAATGAALVRFDTTAMEEAPQTLGEWGISPESFVYHYMDITDSPSLLKVVSPGNVAAGSSLEGFDDDPAYRQFVSRVSLGKRNSPESILDASVFLYSPLAAEINGQILIADYVGGIGNRL